MNTPVPIETLLSHTDFLNALARHLIRPSRGVEDLVQGTWLAVLERPPRHGADPRRWLAAVARNLARGRARSDARRGARERDSARGEAQPSVAEIVEREALRCSVVQAVLALPETYRTVVLLRFYEDRPPRAIAQCLGVPVETVRTRLKRALAQLRGALDAEHGERTSWAVGLAALVDGPIATRGPALATAAKVAALVLAAGGVAVIGRALLPSASKPTPLGTSRLAERSGPASLAAPVTAAEPASRTRAALGAAQPPASTPATNDGPATAGTATTPEATGTVLVRAVDAASGEALQSFQCQFWRPSDGRHFGSDRTDQGLVERTLPTDASGAPVEYEVLSGEADLALARSVVLLRTDGRADALLRIDRGGELGGRVVDSRGAPVADALVFLGRQIRMRGDEPFRPFDPGRIRDGVRTDQEGRWSLRGPGDEVTVWHAGLAPATVARSQAEIVRLAPRGRLAVRLVDADGSPQAHVALAVDGRPVSTDDAGAFELDGVEPGVRGLVLPDGRLVAVDVPSGGSREVEIGPGLPEVRLELSAAGAPFGARLGEGALVSLDPLGSLHPLRRIEDGVVRVSHVLPGRFALLCRPATVATVSIDGPTALVELGDADLTVEAAPGSRVFVAPAGANELVELVAARSVSQRVPTAGEVRFAPLAPGRYAVGIDRHGARLEVVVEGPGARVSL